MRKTVRVEMDSRAVPPLTSAQQAELTHLKKMPDSAIDKSDIPSLLPEFWDAAVPNPYFKPIKASTTVRLDADVLAWFKGQGKGYQTRINAVLREAMLRALADKS